MVICFFLLIHFLVVKDYELPKSTSHILSVYELPKSTSHILSVYELPKSTNHILSVPLNLEC